MSNTNKEGRVQFTTRPILPSNNLTMYNDKKCIYGFTNAMVTQ